MRVYCLKTLKKLSIYPLGNTPSAPSVRRVDSLEASGSGTVSEDELLELKRTRRAAFGG